MNEISRRDVVTGLAASFLAPASFDPSRPLSRIAFGSCGRQTKDQPIWDAVLAAQPDLFVFLGDNIYGDTTHPAVLRRKYAALASKPGFQALRAQVPVMAIWDDHDYGTNDCGVEHPAKEESRTAFCDFWKEPADSARRSSPHGVFTSQMIGPPGREVHVILPDLRWNRTRLNRPGGFPLVAASYIGHHIAPMVPVPGPYWKSRREDATILGDAQWRWLEEELARPAALTILGSSIQVLAQGTGWEAWNNFPHERARLLALVGDRTDVLLLSGDVHYGELSKIERANAPPLWELTSSGITEVGPLNRNRNRVAARAQRNFGVIEIDWDGDAVDLQVRSETGRDLLRQRVPFR